MARLQQKPLEKGPAGLKGGILISPETAAWIKCCVKELKIPKGERSWAAKVVNDFRENLLKFLKSNTDQPFFQSAEFLTSGSYFEKVKIYRPDEFDMMLVLKADVPFTMAKLDEGLFYRLDLKRPTRSPMKAFLLKNERTISSSKILNEMFRLVRKFLKTYKASDESCRWTVKRKCPNSPAVTLSLCRNDNPSDEVISVDLVPALEVHHSQGWPINLRDGPDVINWLGKKVLQEFKTFSCIFVPKRMKGQKVGEDAKESWRISFSAIEKDIFNNHGNGKTCCEVTKKKCCRKQCLMLLKSLIEGLKLRFPEELKQLCSYHGKTAFFHTLSIRYTDSMWAPKELSVCFMYLLGALEDYARTRSLPHFFVPDCNLFSKNFSRKNLDFLANALEEQRREGLPLLQPPAPVPPLGPPSLLLLEEQRREGLPLLHSPAPVPLLEPPSPLGAAQPSRGQLDPQTTEHFNNILVLVFVVTLGLCVLIVL